MSGNSAERSFFIVVAIGEPYHLVISLALAVPIARALHGHIVPLYVSGSAAIPLMDSLLQAGVSPGAMLAFMITGPGTSAGVIAGIASILKHRAIAFYLVCLMVSAIVLGYLYDVILLLL